ncbi:MAG: type II secretion system protein [Myxococcales bacterium]|nr:type II secretion system protein [Myxococcales bacterium]
MSRSSTHLTPKPNRQASAKTRLGRCAQRGLTLFEVLITVVIVAMLSAAVAVGVSHYMDSSNKNLTETNGRTLMQMAEGYRVTENSDTCPTVDEMQEQRVISRGSKTTDAWGKPFRIHCEGDEVVVISAGKDKVFGTDDDIKVPPV